MSRYIHKSWIEAARNAGACGEALDFLTEKNRTPRQLVKRSSAWAEWWIDTFSERQARKAYDAAVRPAREAYDAAERQAREAYDAAERQAMLVALAVTVKPLAPAGGEARRTTDDTTKGE